MQTTLTATLIEQQDNIESIKNQLNQAIVLHNQVQKTLYAEIMNYFKIHQVNSLPKSKINQLKSSYQQKFPINARHYNSIYTELMGKIASVKELNKDYLNDTQDNIKKLEIQLKTKKKTLDSLGKKISSATYKENKGNKEKNKGNILDQSLLSNLKTKIYYINKRLRKAQTKLRNLTEIEQTGNVHLCFGSNKLFRQQFLINTKNNKTGFKSHEQWKDSWTNARHKSMFMLGSSDEAFGNLNCQIKKVEHIHYKNDSKDKNNKDKNNNIDNDTNINQDGNTNNIKPKQIYELKLNVNPKDPKLKNRTMSFLIDVHNDKNGIIDNILNSNSNENINNEGKKNKKLVAQAISYRIVKVKGKNNEDKYIVYISVDKAKQPVTIISSKQLGAIGIDINADHLSVTEVDRFGNLLTSFDVELDLKDKTRHQSLDNIACAVKKITDYAVKKSKPIVIEKLDFSQKKKELKNNNKPKSSNDKLISFGKNNPVNKDNKHKQHTHKQYNQMLSSFAYGKIISLFKSRSFDKGLEVIEVNPAYTSVIGRFKYQNQYKLTTHQSAALVIARRGLLSIVKKIPIVHNKEKVIVNKEKKISTSNSKHYCFGLPDRTIQRKQNAYWREVMLNYRQEKRYRAKKKALVLSKPGLQSETTAVSDNSGTLPLS